MSSVKTLRQAQGVKPIDCIFGPILYANHANLVYCSPVFFV